MNTYNKKDYNNAIKLYVKILNHQISNTQIGGDNEYSVYAGDTKLSNPELLYLSNPTWPPNIGNKITIRDPTENKWYAGTLKNVIWNSTAGVVELDSHYTYQEDSLKDFPEFKAGQNHYLLLPSYHWKYNSTDGFNKIEPSVKDVMNKSIDSKNVINKDTQGLNNVAVPQNEKKNSILENVTLVPDVIKGNTDIKLNDHKVDSNKFFLGTEKINIDIDSSNKSTKKIFNHFQNFKTNLTQITEDMIIEANNPYYKPLLSSIPDFTENKIENNLYNNKNLHLTELSHHKSKLLADKLKNFEVIDSSDIKIIINRNISINNLIADPEDEINEGNKIIKTVNKMINGIFPDIQSKIHAGYVFFTRKGAVVQDVVTKKLVPQLNYFHWQENKPIDYHTLKYVIFQNEYQKSIKENIIQKSEAESILGLEYIIALQCKSEYVLWCLKKLFMIWYSDKELEPIIRKIKVLINQYRADPSHDFNKVNGILPMIVIYPRYGLNNARLLISKLEYYFSLYLEDNFNRTYQEIFYPNSNPTYFLKKNNLLYYTNGSIDLKMYIKESLGCSEKISNDSFTVDMSKLMKTQNVIISTKESPIKKKKKYNN
jgi:hypothetical protein